MMYLYVSRAIKQWYLNTCLKKDVILLGRHFVIPKKFLCFRVGLMLGLGLKLE